MNKSIEEQLKEYIKKGYGDVKTFTLQANIPNSTLSTMFSRGIMNSNIKNVVLLSKALSITVDGLVAGKIISCKEEKNFSNKEANPLLKIYDNLNDEGQRILMSNAEFLNSQPQYKKRDTVSEVEIS